jgi:hypothetical protein
LQCLGYHPDSRFESGFKFALAIEVLAKAKPSVLVGSTRVIAAILPIFRVSSSSFMATAYHRNWHQTSTVVKDTLHISQC